MLHKARKRHNIKQVQKHWPGRRYSYANYSAPLVKHREKKKKTDYRQKSIKTRNSMTVGVLGYALRCI